MRLAAPATSAQPSPVSTSAPDLVAQCTSASRSASVMSSMRTTNGWMPIAANQAGCASHPRAASAARTASGVCAASAVTFTVGRAPGSGWRPGSGAGRLRRWIAENAAGRPLRRLFLLRLSTLGARRWSRRYVGRERPAGDHHLDLLALQCLALQQRRGQAIERGTPLANDTRRLAVGAREDVLHFLVHDLCRAIGNLPALHHFAAQEDLLLAVAYGDRAEDGAHAKLRHHAPRDVGRLLNVLRGARRHLLRPAHQP